MLPESPIEDPQRSTAQLFSMVAGGFGVLLLVISLIGALLTWPTGGLAEDGSPIEVSMVMPGAFAVLALCGLCVLAFAYLAMQVANGGGTYQWRLDRTALRRAHLEFQQPTPSQVMWIALQVEAGSGGTTLETIWRYLATLEGSPDQPGPGSLQSLARRAEEMENLAFEATRSRGTDVILAGRPYSADRAVQVAREIRAKIEMHGWGAPAAPTNAPTEPEPT